LKPAVFVGCATKALSIATALQQQLQDHAEVTIWNEGLFKLSQGTLESLLRFIDRFDFSVLIFTADDITQIDGTTVWVPRDNVVFELGLFYGRLGPRRTFALCDFDEKVKIPSDLKGVTVAPIDSKRFHGDRAAAVAAAGEEIQSAIDEAHRTAELGLLPSTALAIAYVDNFLVPVCTALTAMSDITVGNRVWDLMKNTFKLVVLLPDDFGPSFHANLPLVLTPRGLTQVSIPTASRHFPFFVRADPHDDPVLELYDVPTILSAAWKAIRLYVGKQTVGISPDEAKLQRREIVRFRKAVEGLLEEPDHWGLRTVVEIRGLDEQR
jgi:hypothetical protein